MVSMADAHCPECGAQEPYWNGGKAGYDDDDSFHERIRGAVVEAAQAIREDRIGDAHRILARGAASAVKMPVPTLKE